MKYPILLVGLLVSTAACGSSTNGDATPTGGTSPSSGGQGADNAGGGTAGATASGGAATTGGFAMTGGNTGSGGASAGGTPGNGGQTVAAGGTDSGGSGTAAGGQSSETGGASVAGASTSGCVGQAWPTADPTSEGPFEVAVDKNVGPLAGYLPDPIYGDVQQRFNVYRPANLADSGYCHPILIWANGHGDNPEQNPPDCIIDAAANRWCGTYPPLIEQLASHGFVVVSSLSTTTSRGDPLPTIVGLDWILEQADDSTSPYYHHLDTDHIGALGHSEGGMSTCMAASEPRYSAIATVSGTRELTGLHTPALLICGGQDTVVSCDSVSSTYNAVANQPAMLLDNLSADHGGWLYQNGPEGPSIFALTAWFRVYLMDDTENRAYFFGDDCKLCTDSRVTVERNSLMLAQ